MIRAWGTFRNATRLRVLGTVKYRGRGGVGKGGLGTRWASRREQAPELQMHFVEHKEVCANRTHGRTASSHTKGSVVVLCSSSKGHALLLRGRCSAWGETPDTPLRAARVRCATV